jgi:hypothetical protein
VQDRRSLGPREGPRVYVLRPLVLHPERQRSSQAPSQVARGKWRGLARAQASSRSRATSCS